MTVLPEAISDTSFAVEIDLWDETLREGAERSPLSPSVDEKCDLAVALSQAGVRSLVVGMFPDVPHNIALLEALLERWRSGEVHPATKFVIISHLGITLDQTFARVSELDPEPEPVWLLGIHSASDLQIEHLYPVIRQKDPEDTFDAGHWASLSIERRREENLEWLGTELDRLTAFPGGGVAIGLLDAFRTSPAHLGDLAARAVEAGVGHLRLVDTAGTCVPQQIDSHARPLVESHPTARFYGHFHNDFGLASANAVLGLSIGLAGADVSIGGFANRAGHPALAEVAMALKLLYGVELPDLRYGELYALSRLAERVYGLMESPAQPLTGVITHGVLSGIRTQLIDRAPTIFDVIDPAEIGAHQDRLFGVRSGTDGMQRFLSDHREELDLDEEQVAEMTEPMFELVAATWQTRSENCGRELADTTSTYHRLLTGSAAFTEAEMLTLIKEQTIGARS